MRTGARAAVAVLVALVLLGGAGCSSSSGEPASDGRPHHEGHGAAAADWIAVDDDDALFTVDCAFSHRAPDDPIVHPDRPGASHSHEMFGSTATDASSTGASLQGTATTCDDAEDTAAYWVPTLAVDGQPVDPTLLRAYYRAAPGVDVRDVEAPPLGLAMIAGDPAAGAGADHHDDHGGDADGPDGGHGHDQGAAGGGGAAALGEAGWGCGLRPRRLQGAPPADCTDPSPLTLQLRFPDCWDGERLDSEDHRAHVAASVGGACPGTHPVLLPELQVSIQWPVVGAAAERVTLSSGPVEGAHGDFLNGWADGALEAHIDLCIRARANCTIG